MEQQTPSIIWAFKISKLLKSYFDIFLEVFAGLAITVFFILWKSPNCFGFETGEISIPLHPLFIIYLFFGGWLMVKIASIPSHIIYHVIKTYHHPLYHINESDFLQHFPSFWDIVFGIIGFIICICFSVYAAINSKFNILLAILGVVAYPVMFMRISTLNMHLDWWISKEIESIFYRFDLARTFEKLPQKLQEAKTSKLSGYGNEDAVKNETWWRNKEVDTFTVTQQGTIIDNENKLMWIRAPWGMTWNGTSFEGEPIGLNWEEATSLFGKGNFIQDNPNKRENKEINTAQLIEKGSCKVLFSGYYDWSLPTIKEIDTLLSSKLNEQGLYSDESIKLFESIFVNVKYPNSITFRRFWTANGIEKSTYAWVLLLGDRGFFDIPKTERYSILFVRNMDKY